MHLSMRQQPKNFIKLNTSGMYFVNCFLSPSRFPSFATVLSFVFDFEFEYSLHSHLFYTSRDASFYIPVRLSMITGNSMFIKNNASTNSVLFLLIFIYIHTFFQVYQYIGLKRKDDEDTVAERIYSLKQCACAVISDITHETEYLSDAGT